MTRLSIDLHKRAQSVITADPLFCVKHHVLFLRFSVHDAEALYNMQQFQLNLCMCFFFFSFFFMQIIITAVFGLSL